MGKIGDRKKSIRKRTYEVSLSFDYGKYIIPKTYVKAKHKFPTIILGVIAQIFIKMQYKNFDLFTVFTRKTMSIDGLGNMVCPCIGMQQQE